MKILGKSLRVDHVSDYKPPKDSDKFDDETRILHTEGCAPKLQLTPSQIKREDSQNDIAGERLHVRDVKVEVSMSIDLTLLTFFSLIKVKFGFCF